MPDWKPAIARHLAPLRLQPERELEITEEFTQHMDDRFADLVASGMDSSQAYDLVVGELADSALLRSALPASDRQPHHELLPASANPKANPMADFISDLRYALRTLRQSPAFALFAILTLSLGIGSTATVFTVVNTLLLNPLPVNEPSRLVSLFATPSKDNKQSGNLFPVSYLNLQDYAARTNNLHGVAGFSGPIVMSTATEDGPKRIFGEFVTASYFKTLGLRPVLGRFLQRDEAGPAAVPVGVLSYNAWQGRFAAAPDIIGHTIRINEQPITIIGVAPKGFIGVSPLFGPDVWMPAPMAEQLLFADKRDVLRQRSKPFFHAFARLKPGGSLSNAQAELTAIAAALEREFPQVNEGRTVAVRPITEELFSNTRNTYVFASIVLLAIVGLVLLVACSNVANLLLARATGRQQEIAVRLAMGANRPRLVRQMLTECLLLALLGGIAGLGVTWAGCKFVWSFRPADVVHNLVDPRVDATVFLFALGVSILTAFLFGIVPALRTSKSDVVMALKENSTAAGRSRRTVSLANAILAGQVAISLVALVAAALFLRSIRRAYAIDPGFRTGQLSIYMMNPTQTGYDRARTIDFYKRVRDRLHTVPGVATATWVSNLPFWAQASRTVLADGDEARKKSDQITSVVNIIDTEYFETLGTSLVEGRDFTPADREGSMPAAIINDTLARRLFGNRNALGQHLRLSGDNTPRQIVGIAKTANYTTLGEPPKECVFLPLAQNFADGMNLYVRSSVPPAAIMATVAAEIRQIASNVPITDMRTGQKLMEQVLWSAEIGVNLLSAFGLLALLLAGVGLYGNMAYSVNLRKRDIGLRMALGADRGTILRLVLKQGMSVVAAGMLIGLALSLAVGRMLSRMLFGIQPSDPISIAAASAVLILAALAACLVPARSISRVDPVKVLREA